MIPADVLADLRSDKERFIGTCWIFRQRTPRAVQVVHVDGDRALVVTCLHPPLRRWWVPLASLLVDYSAFEYVCRDEEMGWVRRGAYVASLHEKGEDGGHLYGIVQDVNLASAYVRRLNPASDGLLAASEDLDMFMRTWRPAMSEEEAFIDYLRDRGGQGPEPLPPPPEKPTVSEPPTQEGPSVYERLLDE